MAPALPVYLECGTKRVFACALDWPGWCRSGRDEEAALEALGAYAGRYRVAAAAAGVEFPAGDSPRFTVVERVAGSATTDFGAPGAVPEADGKRQTAATAERAAGLVAACWAVFDDILAGAPASLRKGPRGGGRDRDKIVGHVVEAEAAYARKIGVKHRPPAPGDRPAVEALRAGIVDALRAARGGSPPVPKGWPPRYAARRIAWHVLDHAWEIEDRRV